MQKEVNRKSTGLKRRSVLEQPTKKTIQQNTLKRRGYFAGQEIVDEHRQHLEPDELKLFFRKCEQKENGNNTSARNTKGLFWSSYFTIQFYFGCRLSEPALILDTDDVSVENKQIVIKRLKKKSVDTGFKAFVYPMDDKIAGAVEYIRRWKQNKELEYNPFLFPSRRHQKVCGAERLSQLRNLDGSQAVSRFTADRFFKRIAKDECKFPDNLCSECCVAKHQSHFHARGGCPTGEGAVALGTFVVEDDVALYVVGARVAVAVDVLTAGSSRGGVRHMNHCKQCGYPIHTVWYILKVLTACIVLSAFMVFTFVILPENVKREKASQERQIEINSAIQRQIEACRGRE